MMEDSSNITYKLIQNSTITAKLFYTIELPRGVTARSYREELPVGIVNKKASICILNNVDEKRMRDAWKLLSTMPRANNIS